MNDARESEPRGVSEEHGCFQRLLSDGLDVYRRTAMWSLDTGRIWSKMLLIFSTTAHDLDFKMP